MGHIGEHGHGRDSASVAAGVAVQDRGKWNTRWTLEKRDGDIDGYVKEHTPFWARGLASHLPQAKALDTELREQFKLEVEPHEVIEWDGNLLMNVGIIEMLELLMGAAATTYSNANAELGVGDSNAGTNATHTDLQAAVNKIQVGMNGAYPAIVAQTITFQSDFAGGVGTWAWEECATFNGPTPPGDEMLNRVVQPLGTKAAGATWTLSMAITIS